MHIALFAGEASGDQLGAALIRSMRKINPCIRFNGVGGPLMQEQGFISLFPMEEFSVMGIAEVIKRLPKLMCYRKKLINNYQNVPPEAFVGIDYPEFNLSLAKHFKQAGIYTAHYVSPSVWAWREKRIARIKASCNLMLTLFDFEKAFYDRHQMPAVYCGHPLVDIIPEPTYRHTIEARNALDLPVNAIYLAVLPGSRKSEVSRMLTLFITLMRQLQQSLSPVFLLPAATPALQAMIEKAMHEQGDGLSYRIFSGQSRLLMQASDGVLLASGTATLEAMLLAKPMMVAYQVNALTALLAKRLIKVPFFALPNLIANRQVVPEYIQDGIDIASMSNVLKKLLQPSDYRKEMVKDLSKLRSKIKTNAADNAAQAIYRDILHRGMVTT